MLHLLLLIGGSLLFGGGSVLAVPPFRRIWRATAAPAHRPDYAKIARLELELGLVDPPKLPPPKPVNPTIYDGGASVIRTMITGKVLAKPDHLCSLCIPGRPARNCPFNSVCQM